VKVVQQNDDFLILAKSRKIPCEEVARIEEERRGSTS
jgi:hypothetical protein